MSAVNRRNMSARSWLILGIVLLVLAQICGNWALKPRRPGGSTELHQQLPPGEIAGTVLLGGMRGLAIDILWLRALAAKQEGRLYESVGLYRLITAVQPRFEQVWEYLAWEQAYNIAHESDQPDARWLWFQIGIEANIRGLEFNPRSQRLLRHLAWMFYHRGSEFDQRVSQRDWSPLLNPLLTRYDPDLALPGSGMGAFDLAAHLYQATVTMADREDIRIPNYVRRMPALMIENGATFLRNRGRHLAALGRYLDSLEAWQGVAEWMQNPTGVLRDYDVSMTREGYERNEGVARRRAADLAHRLAKDPAMGERLADAIQERDLVAARSLLAQTDAWHVQVRGASIDWLSERQADTGTPSEPGEAAP